MRLGPWEIFAIILFLPALVVYFLPTIIAAVRHVKNMLGIVLLNVLAGWTFVGWVIALVWSIVDQKQISAVTNIPSATQERFCPKCGSKVSTGDKYCSKCGTELPQG
jgi:hypothetical protein